MISPSADELRVWAGYVRTLCGVQLDESKGYLLESRLSALLRETRSANFSELYYKVKADGTGGLARKVVDAITTNETFFFRDPATFDLLKNKLLPDIVDRKRAAVGKGRVQVRIWSAACSTGQEAYTIAMVAREILGTAADFTILGTDISDQAVAAASRGYFTKLEVERGLPADRLARSFVREGDHYKVRDDLRATCSFRRLNLLEPFVLPGRFDIVFCRNVAIYFSDADKSKMFNRIGTLLEPGGALILGSTETLTGIVSTFEPKRYMRAIFYQAAGFAAPAPALALARS